MRKTMLLELVITMVLGLTGTLAAAAPADSAAHRDALRAKIAAKAEKIARIGLRRFLFEPASVALYRAAVDYHAALGTRETPIELLAHGGRSLELHPKSLKYRTGQSDGQVDPEHGERLAHFGIQTVEQMKQMLRTHLRGVLGVADHQLGDDAALVAETERRVADEKQAVASVVQHPDAQLLLTYHHKVERQRDSKIPPMDLLDSGDDVLHIDESGHPALSTGGAARPVRSADLARLHLGTPEQLQAALDRRLRRAAGLTDEHASTESARQILRARMVETAALQRLLDAPFEHPDLEFLIELRNSLGQHEFEIAQSGKKVLGIEMMWVRPIASKNNTLSERLRVKRAGVLEEGHLATLEDLVRFGVGSKAAFDAAVVAAISSVPLDHPALQ